MFPAVRSTPRLIESGARKQAQLEENNLDSPVHLMSRGTGHSQATVEFSLPLPAGRNPLRRAVAKFPYVPGDASTRDARCEEVYRIQVEGLVTRMRATGTKKLHTAAMTLPAEPGPFWMYIVSLLSL